MGNIDGPRLKSATIMMIDDEPLVMEVAQAYLEEGGYSQFVQLDDSTQAIQSIRTHHPDLLLLDLKMPDVDGYEILEMVRATPGLETLPIIVLTSSTDMQSRLRALDLQATDFIPKPVEKEELLLRVYKALPLKEYVKKMDREIAAMHVGLSHSNFDFLGNLADWVVRASGNEGFESFNEPGLALQAACRDGDSDAAKAAIAKIEEVNLRYILKLQP